MKNSLLFAALLALSLSACGRKEEPQLTTAADLVAPAPAPMVEAPAPAADLAAPIRTNPNARAEADAKTKKDYQDAVMADPNASTKEMLIIAGEKMRAMGYNTNAK